MTTPDLLELTEAELPESGSRCTDILSDTLQGYAGIHQAEFDLQNGRMEIELATQGTGAPTRTERANRYDRKCQSHLVRFPGRCR